MWNDTEMSDYVITQAVIWSCNRINEFAHKWRLLVVFCNVTNTQRLEMIFTFVIIKAVEQ